MTKKLFAIIFSCAFSAFAFFLFIDSNPKIKTRTTQATAPNTQFQIYMAEELPSDWPPQLDAAFPNLKLKDQSGHGTDLYTLLNSLNVEASIIEPTGMNCPGCHAYSGANKYGNYLGVTPQNGLPSFEDFLSQAQLDISDKRFAFVQLLLYSYNMGATTFDDATKWATHFNFSKGNKQIAIAVPSTFQNKGSYDLIPGFLLLNKNNQIVSSAAGHNPIHSVDGYLVPKLKEILDTAPKEISVSDWVNKEIEEQGLSIESAYQQIPHERKRFEAEDSQLSDETKAGLSKLFTLVDLGVVYRVKLLKELGSGTFSQNPEKLYERLVSELNLIDGISPEIQSEIKNAIMEQRDFFMQSYNRRQLASSYTSDSLVQNSSGRLRKAYSLLMSTYKDESKGNKDAFYQHLCALDFL